MQSIAKHHFFLVAQRFTCYFYSSVIEASGWIWLTVATRHSQARQTLFYPPVWFSSEHMLYVTEFKFTDSSRKFQIKGTNHQFPMDECTLASTFYIGRLRPLSIFRLFCWRLKHSSRSLRMNLFSFGCWWIYILSRFCDWTVYMLIFICECWTDCGCVPRGGVYSKLRNAHAQIWVRMWAPAALRDRALLSTHH